MRKRYERVLSLHPTQFSIGLYEVAAKIKDLRKKSNKKRKRIIAKSPIPVVKGPRGKLYLIDHHHLAVVCCHLGIERVPVKVIGNLSKRKLGFQTFWKEMQKNNWAYLYDQFGEGPKNPLYLPEDVRGLADDPYRSLAWLVKQRGGYENSGSTFSEFRWADYFRKMKLLDQDGKQGLKKAFKKALRAAHSPAAKKLPGFVPNK